MPSSLDNLAQNALSTGNGGNPTITGISISTTNATARDMAVTLAVGAPDSGDAIGGTPGTGWSAVSSGWWNLILAAGPLTVAQAIGGFGNYNALQLLALFKTITGQTPVWSNRGGGSGGTVLTPGAFTPTAGNSLLWMNVASHNSSNPSFANDGGLNWTLLANLSQSSVTGGFNHTCGLWMWYAENVPAKPLNLSLNAVGGAGTWGLFEISGILAVSLRLLASTGVGI